MSNCLLRSGNHGVGSRVRVSRPGNGSSLESAKWSRVVAKLGRRVVALCLASSPSRSFCNCTWGNPFLPALKASRFKGQHHVPTFWWDWPRTSRFVLAKDLVALLLVENLQHWYENRFSSTWENVSSLQGLVVVSCHYCLLASSSKHGLWRWEVGLGQRAEQKFFVTEMN